MWFNFLLLLCPPNVLLTTLPFLFSKTKLLEYLFPFKHFPPHILPFQRNKTLLFFLITTTHSYLLSQSLHSFNLLLWFPSIPLFLSLLLQRWIFFIFQTSIKLFSGTPLRFFQIKESISIICFFHFNCFTIVQFFLYMKFLIVLVLCLIFLGFY